MRVRVAKVLFSRAGAGGDSSSPQPLGGYRKRAIDLAIASIALVLLTPIMVIVAVLIRLLFGRPIFVVQQLIGFRGRALAGYEFRTTLFRERGRPPAAARVLLGWRQQPAALLVESALCSSGLDKLPLLFNVLRGDMSLVGPRPIAADELICYRVQAPEYFGARPGIIGIWQHADRNLITYAKRTALDRYYIRHWSVTLDCALLIKSVLASFRD